MLALFGVCLGQKPARIGPDGKPLLNRPDLAECMKSKCSGLFWTSLILSVCVSGKSHMKVGNHNYFLSWREPWHKFEVRWRRADLGLHTPHSQTWPTSRMLIRHGLNSSPPPLLSSHTISLFPGLGLVQWTQLLQRPLYGSCVFQYTRRVRDVFRNHEER